MKRLILITIIILLVVNALLGLLITAYQSTNVYMNSAVIILSGVVLWIVSAVKLKDAFKYSLTCVFGTLGCFEYVLGFFAPTELRNNWFPIMVIALFAIEIIIVLLTNYVTNKNIRV